MNTMCEYYAGLNEESTILRVAEWFLSKAPMSSRKLQTLCYYAYVWYIVFFNEIDSINSESEIKTLGDDAFEAWNHGPTCRRLYNRYGKYADNIPKEANVPIFSDDITDLLNQVWQVYGCLSMFQLEALAHREDPWRQARGSCRIGDACTSKISPLAILRYYSKEQQEWEKEQGALHA